jgi:hypothetical protein
MKVFLFFVISLGVIIWFEGQPGRAQVAQERTVVNQPSEGLELIVVAPQRRYKLSEKITLPVMLFNSGKDDIYVFGTLGWGHSASLLLHVRDSSGKEIEPVGVPDDQTQFIKDDKSILVKLVPNHFLGTNFFAPLEVLNLNRPGRYVVFAEYKSPLSLSDVELRPFWGKERGPINSNRVSIEVVR